MYISKIEIENYKCFKNKQDFNFAIPDGTTEGSGLNVLIGENGSGKTTVLEAINYLTENGFTSNNRLEINDFFDYTKEISIKGYFDIVEKVKSGIDAYNFNNWYFESKGLEFVAKTREGKARGKFLSSSFETSSKFIVENNQYLDHEGHPKTNRKDATIKTIDGRDLIFENSRLVNDGLNTFFFDKGRTRQLITGNYKTTFEKICDDLNWQFLNEFNKDSAPHDEDLFFGLTSSDKYKSVLEKTQSGFIEPLRQEFSGFFENPNFAGLKIDSWDLLHPFTDSFFNIRKGTDLKQIKIKDLGSGVEMILSILLLNQISKQSKGKLIYLIDEPEIHLHPKAQKSLVDLLLKESKDKQIFISTHSPYIYKELINDTTKLITFEKNQNNQTQISDIKKIGGLFGKFSPTWGEINWYAYNLPTVEFHNELYGYIQAKAIDIAQSNYYEENFDQFLVSQGCILHAIDYIRLNKDSSTTTLQRTLQTYIRNIIHHPENDKNSKPTDSEIKLSIEKMIEVIKLLNNNP